MRPAQPKNKDQILSLALPLFANTGFDGISMRDIAQTVGMSAAALYYHFPDKQALYASVFIYAFQQKLREVVESMTAPAVTPVDPQTRLNNLVTHLLLLLDKDPQLRMLLERELLGNQVSMLADLLEKALAKQHQSIQIIRLMVELEPDINPYTLFTHLLGITLHHLEIGKLRQQLSGLSHHNETQDTPKPDTPDQTKADQIIGDFMSSLTQSRQHVRHLPRFV